MTEDGTGYTVIGLEQFQESRRRYFLQAMGVDLYLPRAALPNAALSNTKVSDLPEPLDIDKSSKALGVATSDAERGEVSTRKSPARNLDLSASTKTRPMMKSNEIPARMPAPQFQLRAWRVAGDLLVIDSREGDIALPTETLLRNMLNALGYGVEEIGKGESLRWPLTNAGNVARRDADREEADARAMVQAFIEAQQQRHGFGTLLLLGATAARFALDPPQPDPDNLWQSLPGIAQCRAIVLPSLAELLNQPALKKPTWNAIKQLHRDCNA